MDTTTKTNADVKPAVVQSAELTVVESKLEAAIQQAQLEPSTAQGLLDRFRPLFAKANEICATAESLRVTDATQVTEIKQARSLRLALRAVRIDAEKTRKTLKEDSLRRGKAIDGVYHVLEYAVAPVESRLLDMEEFAARAEAARKAALVAQRNELLKPFGIDTSFYSLGEMSDGAFAQLHENTRLAHEAKIAAARKAEEERTAREKAEAEELERIRQDNERLRREAIEREAAARKERERLEREKARIEAKAKTEREAAEAAAREQRRKAEAAAAAERARVAEAQRAAAEKARKEREELENKAAEERAARERLEAQERERREAEELRQREEAEAAALAAASPDQEKLRSLAAHIRALEVPEMATAAGCHAAEIADGIIADMAMQVEELAAKLTRKEAA
jgi:hypothetical protein